MELPHTFLNDLEIDFQGRLRARWSEKQHAVVIEQRVGKNVLPSLPRQLFTNERRQSLAEGYLPIMTVSASETMKCQECSHTLQVPNRETREIVCSSCRLKGRKTSIYAGFYPLNAFLLNHLKEIDPLRNMERDRASEMMASNEQMTSQMQKSLYDEADAYASDNITKLMNIPVSQYGGMQVKEGTEVKGF